jgi:hypothetical protein
MWRADVDTKEDKTIKVAPPAHGLAKHIAKAEQRLLRGVVERALQEYARKHQPATLMEAA